MSNWPEQILKLCFCIFIVAGAACFFAVAYDIYSDAVLEQRKQAFEIELRRSGR